MEAIFDRMQITAGPVSDFREALRSGEGYRRLLGRFSDGQVLIKRIKWELPPEQWKACIANFANTILKTAGTTRYVRTSTYAIPCIIVVSWKIEFCLTVSSP